ncbi:MAG: DUF2130 domain-containing protein [Epsilonproteobacteria bacterium]|nr:DUF2130 domain-containing protein [Campylobacterota bacterium]
MDSKPTVECPNCGTVIDIDEVFYKRIEAKFMQKHKAERQRLQAEIEAKRQEYKAHLEALKAKESELTAQKEAFEQQVGEAVRARLKEARKELDEEIRKRVTAEQSEAMEALKKELARKSEEVKELTAAKIEIEKLKREKDEAAMQAKLEAEKALNARLEEERKRLERLAEESVSQKLKTLQEQQELKLKEKEEQLKQLQKSLEEAKRKAEQGSMQVQGEALELSIEAWLREQFPFDTVEEVKKGAFGADCVQRVNTREAQNCGVICYESKNTKAWNDEWVAKLKQDMLRVKADIGVLVSTVYPRGMSRMGWVDGVWVCSLEEFKGSAALLRESLIRVHKATQKEQNKATKMELLYDYLAGNEFQMQLNAIVEGFMKMQEELEREKRSLMASWKRRQKLIDGVLTHTTEMYGALQGIAGSGAIPHIKALEMSEGED